MRNETETIKAGKGKAMGHKMLTIYVPSKSYIENFEIGTKAPYCFGGLRDVVEVFAINQDVNGKIFACYYIKHSENSRISGSVKEGEIVRDLKLTCALKSAEIDEIQRMVDMGEKVVEYNGREVEVVVL